MNRSEQEFLAELRKAFSQEAEEHLQTIASGLVEIEKGNAPSDRQAVMESVYRAAHSLKGAARSVNLTGIATLCQSMENVFAALKRGVMTPRAEDFDVLQRAVDRMAEMLAAPVGGPEPDPIALAGELDRLAPPAPAPPRPTPATDLPLGPAAPHTPKAGTADGPAAAPPAAADTIRIATAKLDAILLQAEELISVKLAAEQRIAELAETLATLEAWKTEHEQGGTGTGCPAYGPAPAARSAAFEGDRARLRELHTRLRALLTALRADRRATGVLVDQLLDDTKTVLMLPFSNLFQALPRMVRDLAREQGKEVDLVLSGGETEIDKRILERMKDPLIHLLRNCVDHGLEPADVRRTRNKRPAGTIAVHVSPAEGNRVLIRVSDDGAGIDTARLRQAAVRNGVLSTAEAEALDEEAARALMFRSGVSTSARVTDLSGRGLGMAIVKEAVDKMGGTVVSDTTPGQGTTFRIALPLTLATFHGLMLQEYGGLFGIPTSNVEHALRVRKEDVRSVENRETIQVDGAPVALMRLGQALGMAPSRESADPRPFLSVVVLACGSQRMAFAVDRLLHEQEILLKGLGRQLVRVRNIAGATVLGSGKVVPVLNVADLFKSAVMAASPSVVTRAPAAPAPRKSLLVVEDSITSRMLLKSILASAGFDVQTVVDGVEAWDALQERTFDAVVSDIEMPRLNGFDLTARIRGDAKLAELPVVLVTSLESKPDRERGIEVGANAYIVKSSFEQSNLLDVVRRLI